MRVNYRISLLTAAVLALAVFAWYMLGATLTAPDGQKSVAGPDQLHGTTYSNKLPSERELTKASPALPLVASAPVSVSVVGDWKSVYTSRDPYPAVIALREARQKGTFAASFELHLACLDALIAISRQPNAYSMNPTEADELLQARIQAKQEIEVRCSRFSGQDILSLSEPLAGDISGERYRHAMNVLQKYPGFQDPKRVSEAFAEAADQGQLAASVGKLSMGRTWRGESWKDRVSEYDTAIGIAAFLASSNEGASGIDLRTLTGCYRAGSCQDDRLASSLAYFPAERRPAVEALARDMAQALRVGDVGPWLPATK